MLAAFSRRCTGAKETLDQDLRRSTQHDLEPTPTLRCLQHDLKNILDSGLDEIKVFSMASPQS